MKILVGAGRIKSIGGGAERSLLSLLTRLSEKHRIKIFNIVFEKLEGNNDIWDIEDWEWPDLPCIKPHHRALLKKDKLAQDAFDKLFQQFRPELVITQYPPVIYQNIFDVPLITFIRDLNYIKHYEHRSKLRELYNLPFIKVKKRRMLKGLKESQLFITNSKFMQDQFLKYGIQSSVIYPFINCKHSDCKSGNIDGPVTLIAANLSEHKGIDIFFDIARRMPERRFVMVARSVSSLEVPNNVKSLGWSLNPQEIISKSSVVLIPSRCEESFGRVPIEAGCMGIPFIASTRGGLPEASGKGGILIDDIEDIDLWTKKIDDLLRDPHIYKRMAQRSYDNAKRFTENDPYEHFRDTVLTKLGIEL